MPTRRELLGGFALVGFGPPQEPAASKPAGSVEQVRALLAKPERTIPYLEAKLHVDQVIAPFDAERARSEIGRLVEAAAALSGNQAPDAVKLSAIRRVIYEPGVWNAHRAFTYDLADPEGRVLKNKLLATYLRARKGNCVTMPILFLILSERLGLSNVALASAPLHLFVRYTSLDGRVFNLETTSGGHVARDAWYRQNLPMTDLAIANGVYMRSLGRREAVASMAILPLEWLLQAGRYEEAARVADLILEVNPRDAFVLAKKGSAFGHMLNLALQSAGSASPSPDLRERLDWLHRQNQEAFRQAEELGWTPAT